VREGRKEGKGRAAGLDWNGIDWNRLDWTVPPVRRRDKDRATVCVCVLNTHSSPSLPSFPPLLHRSFE
jgi:hypothetical protein